MNYEEAFHRLFDAYIISQKHIINLEKKLLKCEGLSFGCHSQKRTNGPEIKPVKTKTLIEATLTTAAVATLPFSAAVGVVVGITLLSHALPHSQSRRTCGPYRRDPVSLKRIGPTSQTMTQQISLQRGC